MKYKAETTTTTTTTITTDKDSRRIRKSKKDRINNPSTTEQMDNGSGRRYVGGASHWILDAETREKQKGRSAGELFLSAKDKDKDKRKDKPIWE